MTYPETIQLLTANLSSNFDTVYHSAEVITIESKNSKDKFPAITKDNEWIKLAPTDIKEGVYIRRNGDDEVSRELKLSSCGKAYEMRSQLRIVYFKDNAKNHEEILFKLMQSALTQSTKIKSIIRDKFKLLKDESTGDYNFKPTTCYFAIDIYGFWNLNHDMCEQDFCIDVENPVCKNSESGS